MEIEWMKKHLRTYRRNKNLHAFYAHGDSCLCGKCHPSAVLADFDNRFNKIGKAMEADFIKRLHGSKWGANDIDAILWREYYSRLRRFAEGGYGRTLTNPKDWAEFELMERIKRNMSGFSGGKVRTIAEELRPLRNLPLADFEKAAKKVLKRHHKDYLEAELQTALASANSAARWEGFEKRSYLYPNLRYETAGDERVRESHEVLDGRIHPINSPFWDTFMPPNGWRCRCIVIQTDDPATGSGFVDFEPPKGFRNNPGKTGKLFESDHPYFDWSKKDSAAIVQKSEELRTGWEQSEVFKIANTQVGKKHKLPGMANPADVTTDFVQKTMGSKHTEQALLNDLLTVLALLAQEVRLLTIGADTYIYKVVVAGTDFTLEVKNNVFQIIK